MTCVIATIKNNVGYIAGDKCASAGTSEKLVKNSKIFKKTNVLLGVCGSFRLINIINNELDMVPVLMSSMTVEEFSFNLANTLLDMCEERKCLVYENGEAYLPSESEVVVIFRNNIITIHSDFAYTISEDDYVAIGIPEHAEGFIEAKKGSDPMKVIKSAMAIAAKNNSSVSREYDLLMEKQS